VNTGPVSNTRKQPKWLHTIIAGAAMLAISSLLAVLIFDWYFFSLIDALSTSLRPIAGAFRHATADTAKNARNAGDPGERREQPGTKDVTPNSLPAGSSTAAKAITEKSDQRPGGDQAGSLFVPVRSAADAKAAPN
jgi:hypothetical protein